ncbi:unnamed protein product, partial [Effrenium voratum]
VSNRSIYVLLIVSCLSLLGLTMPSPALPLIRSHFGLVDWQTGLVSSCMSLGMLAAVAVWPSYSDTLGRKKVLTLSLFCTAGLFCGQVMKLKPGSSFQEFLLMRFLTGLFAGCNPIFKAYLADVVPSEQLPRFMVFREASATLAFIIGPALGGFLCMDRGLQGPFFATILAHLAGALLLLGFVEEAPSIPPVDEGKAPEEDAQEEDWPLARKVFAISFFYVVSQTCFSFFMPLLLHDLFGSQPQTIGAFLTGTSLVVFFCQVVVYKRLEKRFGLEVTGALGAAAIFLGLVTLSLRPQLLPLAAALYAFGSATFPATVPTLLAKSVSKGNRGKVLGMDSVINNVGRVITPLGLGVLYGISPSLCFMVGGCASLVVVQLLRGHIAKKGRDTLDIKMSSK